MRQQRCGAEGAAQRVQEDTKRFAMIAESLGVKFIDSLMTLAAFLPILWGLSAHITLALLDLTPEGAPFELPQARIR